MVVVVHEPAAIWFGKAPFAHWKQQCKHCGITLANSYSTKLPLQPGPVYEINGNLTLTQPSGFVRPCQQWSRN